MPELPAAAPTPGAWPAPAIEADRALVEEAVRQGGVATERLSPRVADYAYELTAYLGGLLERLIKAAGGAVPESFGVGCLGFIVVLALLLACWLALRMWLRRSKKEPAAVELAPASSAPALPPGADWEGELEGRLVRGEVHAALEALWWWLAGRLGAPAAESSWTTRELVARAGRRDLLRLVTPLDRLIYGAGQPTAGEVRGLFDTLRAALPVEPAQ